MRIMRYTAGFLAFCSHAGLVAAQDASPVAPAPVDSESTALEDIVVTAQKRSERLQDVPIAVTALTSASLDKARTLTTQDLQVSVPGLVYSAVAGFAQPYLRGIGSDITAPNADPSVATYIDGAFISNNQATITSLLGVERIEVLAGPQGTLYGRNAVGGAINIYTLTPETELDGKLTATYGNFDRYEASGYVSGGLGDTLAVGLYVAYTQRDNYLDILQVGSTEGQPDHEINWGVRLKAVWTPSETFRLTASGEITKLISLESQGFRNEQPNAFGYALGAPAIIKPYFIQTDLPLYTRTRQKAVTLREELDLGWANLLGISNYRDVRSFANDDIDATIVPIYGGGQAPNTSRQYSQEVQLLSPAGSSVNWIVGAFYFHERTGFFPNGARSALLFPAPINGIDTTGGVNVRSMAIFGQATVPIDVVAEGMKLTLGGRYTIDRKKLFGARQDFLVDDLVVQSITYPDDRKTWKEFTPKITLDYKTGGTLLYATYSKGFKAGAYNIPSPTFDPKPVDPETLSAFEIGTKSDIAGGTVRFNTAAYYYDFKNIQVQVLDVAAGAATVLQNAASAEAYGVEATLAYRVTRGLTLNGNIAWEHSEYKNFPNFASFDRSTTPSTSIAVDVSGNQLQRAPTWVWSLAADYTHEFGNGGTVNANINWYHNDGFAFDAARLQVQKAYDVVNASVAYTLPGDQFTLSAWASNLTDNYYRTAGLLTPFNSIVLDGPPRMYGVTLTAKVR